MFLHGSMAPAHSMLAPGKHSHGLLWLLSRLGLHLQKLLTSHWMRIADANTCCNTMSLCFLCTVPLYFLLLIYGFQRNQAITLQNYLLLKGSPLKGRMYSSPGGKRKTTNFILNHYFQIIQNTTVIKNINPGSGFQSYSLL